MFNATLTVEQRYNKAVVDILHNPRYTALSGVLLMGKSIVVDIPMPFTACTNGRDCAYGREFMDALNDAQFRFVVLHENYHKLYRHTITWQHLQEENAQCANMACDFVINGKIVADNEDGFASIEDFPFQLCYSQKYLGPEWDAARVFEDLKQNGLPEDCQPQPGDTPGAMDEHDWEGAEALSEQERQQLERELDAAIRQGAMLAGKTGAELDGDLKTMMEPQVDWRKALREFITETCVGTDASTWSRPNRRFIGRGYYMPSGISTRVRELVVAPDTSGSCMDVLGHWWGEIIAICETVKPEKVHILWWDAAVENHEILDLAGGQQMDKLSPRGGGGTCVECVPKYMAEQGITPQAAIVLTDGYLSGGWGDWKCPVMWCLVDNKAANPPNGKRVHIQRTTHGGW